MGYILTSSDDLWTGLEFVLSELNKELSTMQFDYELYNGEGIIVLNIHPKANKIRHILVETVFSFFSNVINYLRVPDADMIEYHFAFEINDQAISQTSLYNAKPNLLENKIVIPASCLHAVSPLADKHTFRSARQLRLKLNQTETHDSLEERIKNILLNSEYELPTLEAISEKLFSTPWTISRKLKKLGTSYQALVDEVRINKASHLLTHSKINVSEIAQMLGYSDVSSFRRAFRRWFGVSPREFRDAKEVPSIIRKPITII